MDYRFLVPIGAAIAVFTGFATGIGEARIACKAIETMGKNPEMASTLRSTMIIGDAISETCAIYGLLVALLLIFAF